MHYAFHSEDKLSVYSYQYNDSSAKLAKVTDLEDASSIVGFTRFKLNTKVLGLVCKKYEVQLLDSSLESILASTDLTKLYGELTSCSINTDTITVVTEEYGAFELHI